jgi:uncharacterized protein YunC (DUF1805 family)
MSGNSGASIVATEIDGIPAQVAVLPIGPVSLVYAKTAKGILACGAIDPAALQKFGLPAARVKPVGSPSITSLADLLAGEVREANDAAQALGVTVGMKGREVIAKLA